MKVILLLLLFSLSFSSFSETTSSTSKTKTVSKSTSKKYKKKRKLKKRKSKRKKSKRTKRKKSKKPQSSYIDDTQRFISDFWVGINYNMDSFFSDQEYNRKENKSRILAYYEVYKHESSKTQKLFDIKIKVHFPKLSKRLSVTVEKERDEILESRTNQASKSQATSRSDYTASVNYEFSKTPLLNTKLSTGFRFTLPLDPFAKLKFYKDFQTKIIDIHFEQMFIFYRQDYLREYTQLSFSKKINDNLSISQTNTLSWTDSDDEFFMRNSLSLGQRIDDKKGLTYSIGANAEFDPTYYYNSYDASIGYHQRLYKDWFFGSLSVGTDFQRSSDWEMSHFFVVRTEVLFK